MTAPNAQVKMKALVAARLLMGDFDSWERFREDRNLASNITNRQKARSVSAQIGRKYSALSAETRRFIFENFGELDFENFAILCDSIQIGKGIYLRIDEFEQTYFPISAHIKDRFPFYAHVSITPYGLQFEFPEHHFLRDLEAALSDLAETRSRIAELTKIGRTSQASREAASDLLGRDKFLSRNIISSAFSLVEAFLSGLFFTAVHTHTFGKINCDKDFIEFATRKESAPLKLRIDRVVRFASRDTMTGDDDPFESLIEFGKPFRDAIHHTTPFERRDIEAGGRLLALYRIDSDVALQIAIFSFDTVLRISAWAFDDVDATDIGARSHTLKDVAINLTQGPLSIDN